MRGFVKSSSRRPHARNIERAPARCGPSVSALLRGFSKDTVTVAFSSAGFLGPSPALFIPKNWGHHLGFDDGPETLWCCCARRPSSICYSPYDDRGNSYDSAKYKAPTKC